MLTSAKRLQSQAHQEAARLRRLRAHQEAARLRHLRAHEALTPESIAAFFAPPPRIRVSEASSPVLLVLLPPLLLFALALALLLRRTDLSLLRLTIPRSGSEREEYKVFRPT
jgi:hypothetical protein